jgi:hypothetical protein
VPAHTTDHISGPAFCQIVVVYVQPSARQADQGGWIPQLIVTASLTRDSAASAPWGTDASTLAGVPTPAPDADSGDA